MRLVIPKRRRRSALPAQSKKVPDTMQIFGESYEARTAAGSYLESAGLSEAAP